MTRLPSLSIRLVPPPPGTQGAWPLDRLRIHLIARAIRRVVDDEFSVESYGMAAADRALSRFAWPRVVHELVGVYRRVAALDRVSEDDEDPEEAASSPDEEDTAVPLDNLHIE